MILYSISGRSDLKFGEFKKYELLTFKSQYNNDWSIISYFNPDDVISSRQIIA